MDGFRAMPEMKKQMMCRARLLKSLQIEVYQVASTLDLVFVSPDLEEKLGS